MKGFMVANIWPTKPSGVQLISPITPPGRQTRTNSSAEAWWCGANITPMQESTPSKLSLSNGNASALASTQRKLAPRAWAISRPRSSRSGHRSLASHVGAEQRSGYGYVSRPGRNVEDTVTRADSTGRQQNRTQRCHDFGRHSGVVAQRPQRAMLAFVSAVERGAGHSGHFNVPSIRDLVVGSIVGRTGVPLLVPDLNRR